MAVESRFVVIRQGVEVKTFMDKKAADEYDKMLDMADSLSVMFENAPVELSEVICEELAIYLAQNREQLLVALQVKKAKPAAPAKAAASAKPAVVETKTAETAASKVASVEEKPAKAKPTKAAKAKKKASDEIAPVAP